MISFNGEALVRVAIYVGDFGQPEIRRLERHQRGGRYVPERLVLAYEAAESAHSKAMNAYWDAGEAIQNWEGQQ